jgi:hypothetical protein
MSLLSGTQRARADFTGFRKGAEHLEAVERVKDWTRARFALDDADAIVVSELACALPGFPPLETVVAFWTGDGTRHHFKTFKPVGEVAEADLPPAWMKNALAAGDGVECYCC